MGYRRFRRRSIPEAVAVIGSAVTKVSARNVRGHPFALPPLPRTALQKALALCQDGQNVRLRMYAYRRSGLTHGLLRAPREWTPLRLR